MTLLAVMRRLTLLAVNGCLAALLWHEMAATRASPSVAEPAQRSAAVRSVRNPSTPAAEQAPAVAAGRDLFAGAASPTAASAASVPATPLPPPQIVLVGTALGEASFAVVRSSPGAPTERIREGAMIGDWRLGTIRRNAIVVVHGKERWSIGFAPAQPLPCADPACAD